MNAATTNETPSRETADTFFCPKVILLDGWCSSLLSFWFAAADERCEVDGLWTGGLHKYQSVAFAVVSDADAAKISWEQK